MTPEALYLLHERISIKVESRIPEHLAELQAREELFPESRQISLGIEVAK
jgi:hypothetical protein